jgi:adenylosuccinate lyase
VPFEHDTYISPLTWRYASAEMRSVWSEDHKRRLMRRLWVALAAAQHEAGLVTAEQLADLRAHAEEIDIDRTAVLERETRHDVMAEILTFAEQCPVGGAIIHWGATSTDVTDNVDALRLREALALLLHRQERLLACFADRIEATAALPAMAYTHMQPAEPTTVGYRLAVYAQDLLRDLEALRQLATGLRGKGLKGAVGTQASYQALLAGTGMTAEELEARAMAHLQLPYFPIATQTYTRQQDLRALQVLAAVAASLHKFAFDFRLLQSPPFGEWAEPFGRHQVGSSAMPFKRNPIISENICSLARFVAAMPAVAWDNASQAVLERSLDDSANRRLVLPEAFLTLDEMLLQATRLVAEMRLNEAAIGRNLVHYGPFAATEQLLMALVRAGADRQAAHEWIRAATLEAWAQVEAGASNPLADLLARHDEIGRYLSPGELAPLMDAAAYTGTAAARASAFAANLRAAVQDGAGAATS